MSDLTNGAVYSRTADAAELSRDIAELYRTWWVGDKDSAIEKPVDVSKEIAVERHPTEVWTPIHMLPDGAVRAGRGGEIALARAGEWLAVDSENIHVSRRSVWREGDFVWRASKRSQPAAARRWAARMYISASEEDEPREELLGLCGALDNEGLWFEAKAWLGPPIRRDQIVIWVEAADAEVAISTACASLRKAANGRPAPALTLSAGHRRIGVAHDPVPGASLGMRICGAIVTAGDLDEGRSWASRWRSACQHYELTPEKPWRHPGGVDPYDLWARLETEWA